MADKRKVNPQNVFAAMKYLVDHRGEPYKKVAEGLEQEGFTWTIQDARYYREDHPVNGSAADGLKYADVGAGLETVANCYSNRANYEATQHYLFDAPKGEKTPAEVFVQKGFELGWAPDFDGDKDSSLVWNGKNVPAKDAAETGGVVKFENDTPSKPSPLDYIEHKQPISAEEVHKSLAKGREDLMVFTEKAAETFGIDKAEWEKDKDKPINGIKVGDILSTEEFMKRYGKNKGVEYSTVDPSIGIISVSKYNEPVKMPESFPQYFGLDTPSDGTKPVTMILDTPEENKPSRIKLSKEDAAKELPFDISVTDTDGKIVPPSSGFMSGLRGAMGSGEERSHMIDYLKMKDDAKNLQNKDTDGPDVT